MAVICIFNPEHDLCMANGSSNYMPPESALRFARESAGLMRMLYPEAQVCIPSPLALPSEQRASRFLVQGSRFKDQGSILQESNQQIIPWGWNIVLHNHLVKLGVDEACLPTVDELSVIRRLQHRSTILPLQPHSVAATEIGEVKDMIARHHAVVMKAPWSGSGRGLRWVTGEMSPHDISWMQKVVKNQECVIVEPRQQVASEFALEYYVGKTGVSFRGFSFFTAANGVYRGNLLLSDDQIRERVCYTLSDQAILERWLESHIVGQYEGPLGIDYLHTTEGQNILSEINFRHTMGMVAHEYLRQHPEQEGEEWTLQNCCHE